MDRNRHRWQPCRLCGERLPRGRLRPYCGVAGIRVRYNDHLVSRVMFEGGFPARVDQSWIEPLPLVCRAKERCQARRCEVVLQAGQMTFEQAWDTVTTATGRGFLRAFRSPPLAGVVP